MRVWLNVCRCMHACGRAWALYVFVEVVMKFVMQAIGLSTVCMRTGTGPHCWLKPVYCASPDRLPCQWQAATRVSLHTVMLHVSWYVVPP